MLYTCIFIYLQGYTISSYINIIYIYIYIYLFIYILNPFFKDYINTYIFYVNIYIHMIYIYR